MFTGWHDIQARPNGQFIGNIDTHQSDWELRELIEIYKALSPGRIVEVGSFRGGTLYQWLKYARPGAVVVNIDNFDSMNWMENRSFIEVFGREWQSWVHDGMRLYTLVKDSHAPDTLAKVLEYIDDGIEFLFIDADHSYEAVCQDFNDYGNHVKKGGIIALHDIKQQDIRPNYGVWKLWNEIKEAGYVTRELKVIGDGKGIGVVYV